MNTAPWNTGYITRSSNEVKDERYPRSYARRMQPNGTYSKAHHYCARMRCNNIIELFQSDEGLKFPHDTVIVSMDDGDTRQFYCTIKCASSDLATMVRKEKVT